MGCKLGLTMGTCVERVTPCTSPSVCEHYTKGISSHLADAFFQVDRLREEQSEESLVKLKKSLQAISNEIYALKHRLEESARVINSMV